MSRFFIACLATVALFSCNTKSVSSITPKDIYIASDFLMPSDTVFFQGFTSEKNIRIHILNMTVDSMITHHKKFKYNSTFDGVILNSTFALYRLSKNQVLHEIPATHRWKDEEFVSPKNDWLILGIDPYVIESKKQIFDVSYNDLTFGEAWSCTLTENEMVEFNVSAVCLFGKTNIEESQSWLEKMRTVREQLQQPKDSTKVPQRSLTRLSKLKNATTHFAYPNQIQKNGVFYDGVGAGIVRHSPHFSVMLDFLNHYQNIVFNERLCNRLYILPIHDPNNLSHFEYQNEYPLLFRCSPRKAVSYFHYLNKLEEL